MTAASRYDDPFDRTFAGQARFAFAPIHSMLQLEEAFLAIRVNVVSNAGTAHANCLSENFLKCKVQSPEFVVSKGGCTAARPNACTEQGLVGIDIANAAQKILVQQGTFDRSLAATEEGSEILKNDLQRFGAWGFEFLDYAESPEAAWVHETQFASGGKSQNCMRVFRQFMFWRADEQASSHAQVNDPLDLSLRQGFCADLAVFEIEDDVLADPMYAGNPA